MHSAHTSRNTEYGHNLVSSWFCTFSSVCTSTELTRHFSSSVHPHYPQHLSPRNTHPPNPCKHHDVQLRFHRHCHQCCHCKRISSPDVVSHCYEHNRTLLRITPQGLDSIERQCFIRSLELWRQTPWSPSCAHHVARRVCPAPQHCSVQCTAVPPDHPVHPNGATQPQITEINHLHKAMQLIFRTYDDLDKDLTTQIIEATLLCFINALSHPTLGFTTVTCLDLLTHHSSGCAFTQYPTPAVE